MRFIFSSFGFLLLCISFSKNLAAQTDYWWRSQASSGNWNNSNNWWNGANATPGFGNLKFDNTTYSTMNNNITNLNTHAIYFLNGSSSRTISGNGIQLSDFSGADPRIKNETSNTQTIDLTITGDGDQADPLILEAHSGQLTLDKIDNNGSDIWNNSDNAQTIVFQDVISGAGDFYNKNNTYAKFQAANTISGDFYIEEGEVWIEEGGSFNSLNSLHLGSSSRMGDRTKLFISDLNGGTTLSNNITVNNGSSDTRYIGGLNTTGTNTFSGNISLNRYLTIEITESGGTVEFSGVISGSHGIDKIDDGTAIFSGNNTYTGQTTIKAGKLTVNSGGSLGNNADVLIQSGATLEINTNVSVDDLNLNAGGTLNIGSNSTLTVNGTLTLGDDIDLNDGDLVIGSSGSISGGSSSSYIAADGSGTLKQNVGTSAVEFPVGTSSSYMPVEINTNSGSADFEVRLVSNSYQNAAEYLDKNWVLTTSGSQTVDLKFTWPSSEEGTSFPTSTINLHKDGTKLTYNVSKSGSDPYYASYSNVSCCSQFSPGGTGTVPVELIYFSAIKEEKNHILKWATASEKNNNYFLVERSYHGQVFDSIGLVKGHGTSQNVNQYTYVDHNVHPDYTTYFYRLKQMDFDGSFEYSPVQIIHKNDNHWAVPEVYPNPFKDFVYLDLNGFLSEDFSIEIRNPNGCLVSKRIWAAENHRKIAIDLSKQPEGIYFLKVSSNTQVQYIKLLKK